MEYTRLFKMMGQKYFLSICLFIVSFCGFTVQNTYGQVAFMGYDYKTSTYPLVWSLNPPTFNAGTNNEVKLTMVDGALANGQICSANNNGIDHYYLGGTTQQLEITIPQHAVAQFMVILTGSTNSTSSSAKAGVVYSDKVPFDPNSCIAAEQPEFPSSKGNWTDIILNPPANAKSLRIYRRVFYGTGTMNTSSGGGRTQYGDNTSIRIASVAVWATATPTQQTQNLAFTNVSTSAMNVSFTRGNGTNVVVFAKEGVGAITNPVANKAYTASSDWKKGSPTGTQLGTSGYYNVYNGTGSTFSLSNLKPATQYTLQAFEYTTTPTDLKYLTTTATGNPSSQTTKALSKPTVTTNAITNILSNKATCGGTIPDSGGVAITEKGLVWGTTSNPTTANSKLALGSTAASFSDFIKGLTPLTKYYVRAYAINSLGITYGNEQNFTTTGPVPILSANPGSIDFGENYYNTSPFTISYTLTGTNLSPSSGNITITAPSGFLVSKSGNTGFATTLTIPYTGGAINALPIYAQLPVTSYGVFTGNITHSGGGTAAVDADIVKLSGSVIQSEEELSNKGTDFWLGFGYQENMRNPSGSDEAKLSVYIAAGDQAATVVVDMPGISSSTFPRAISIPANSVTEVKDFPTGDDKPLDPSNSPDSRLYFTGVTDRGIHVYSTNGAPVSVFMYTSVTGNSAAGSMIFPTNTWNSSYNVQAYGGKSNNKNPNSFFFVIANQDNTEIEFNPTNDILNSNTNSIFTDNHTQANIGFAKNVSHKVTLNKGQIFNAMGFIIGTGDNAIGLDLSGTTVKTTCDKKIAVFAGNGRCLLGGTSFCTSQSEGSDNLIQQMFPNVAWGTKYLTVPTKSMEYNIFRIYVQDASTIVKVNGNVLPNTAPTFNATALYYNLEGNKLYKIESDKPINVTQFVNSKSCAINSSTTGSNGLGDPEMIILSPVQQAINNTTVFSPTFKNGKAGASYINVVIKKEGVASFKLDNTTLKIDTGSSSYTGTRYGSNTLINMVDAFKPHPGDPVYCFAKFKVATGAKHTLSSDQPFNAVAYGMNDGESYGFNAGTAIKNLTSLKIAVNPSGVDTSSTSVKTGKNNPVTLKIALPHNPNLVDYITWNSGTDPRISPAGSTTGAIDSGTGKAKFDGTIDIDGRTFYIYTSPIQYQFSEDGIYRVTATATGTFISECGGQDVQKIVVQVGRDNINFDFTTTCGNPNINFINNTTAMPGTTITKWAWDFGDNSTSTLKDPLPHLYDVTKGYKYTVKLTTTNSVGSVTTDSLKIDFSGGLATKFTISAKEVCAGTKVNFDPSSSAITGTTSGTAVSWTWDFGEGTPLVITGTTSPTQEHTYLTAGKYKIKLTLKTTQGCENTYTDSVVVSSAPTSVIEAPLVSCFGSDIDYLDKSTITVGEIDKWLWKFDDNTTSALQNPKHKWLTTGNHKATLTVTSKAGCPAINIAEHTVNVLPLPTAVFTASTPLCVGTKVVFTDASTPNTPSTTISEWVWDFGDGSPLVTKTVSDTISHVYKTANTFKVKLTVKNAAGCLGDFSEKPIVINAIPEPSFTVTAICVPTGSAQFTGANAGTATITSWLWDFGDGGTAAIKNPLHTFAAGGKYSVKLIATSNNGCAVTFTNEVEVFDAPTPSFTVTNQANLCSDAEVKITDLSAVNGYGAISKLDVYWDYINQPSIKSSFDNPAKNTVYQNLYPNPLTTASKTYRVLIRVFTNATCFKETYQDIVINAMPVAKLLPFTAVCEEKAPFNLSGGSDQRNLPGAGVYSGAGIINSPSFSPALAGPGTHLIRYTYTTTSGCTSIAEQEIVVNPTPEIDLGNKIIYIKDKESAVLTPNIIKGTNLTFTWSPSKYLSSASVQNPTCRPLDDVTYTVTATSAEGCTTTATVVVNLLRELVPPNTFTPNGDNINDKWEIKYFDTYPNATVSVFNRYGKKVFQAESGSASWDGRFNGADLPVGTYYYIVDAKDGSKTITGSVTIIR